MSRDRYQAAIEKRANVVQCEAKGEVADSLEVRLALIAKARSGECTLEEVQAELKKIKRNAKKNGKITRNQAFTKG